MSEEPAQESGGRKEMRGIFLPLLESPPGMRSSSLGAVRMRRLRDIRSKATGHYIVLADN